MSMLQDFTPTGVKIEGTYENDRNAESADLFKAIVREACGAGDVIIAHHIVYVCVERRDGFDYQIVEEIPSADALIFDHDIARKIWGRDYATILAQFAAEPVATRDKLLAKLYYGRVALKAAA